MISSAIEVVLYGMGEVNQGALRMIQQKSGVRVVGAIDVDTDKVGRDPGTLAGSQPTGVVVSGDPVEVLTSTQPHIVIHATTAWTAQEMLPQVRQALEVGIDVISSCVGLFYPFHEHPELARRVSRLAREHGATFLSTGIMPGFIMDNIVDAFTAMCESVERIEAQRVLDFSPFGPEAKKVQGIGFTPEQWERKRSEGEIRGHDCFRQQMRMVADVTGLRLDRVREKEFVPLVAEEPRSWRGDYPDLEPGTVAGLRHVYEGIRDGAPVITMSKIGSVEVEKDGYEQSDEIVIEGHPDLEVKTALPPGVTTWAPLVNSIPEVLNAEPGLRTVNELPVPSVFQDDLRRHLDDPYR